MKLTFFTLFAKLLQYINTAITIVVSLAVVGFLYGVVKILFSSDNQVAKKEGRDFMMYGVFILFVMTSMWGFVNLLSGAIVPNTGSGPAGASNSKDGVLND